MIVPVKKVPFIDLRRHRSECSQDRIWLAVVQIRWLSQKRLIRWQLPDLIVIRQLPASFSLCPRVARGEFKDMMRGSLPLVPSHEPTGVIAALGDEVAAASSNSPGTGGQGPFEVGDRVGALAFKDFCGQCEDCKRGDPKFCDSECLSFPAKSVRRAE